jgi:hypothetical protein
LESGGVLLTIELISVLVSFLLDIVVFVFGVTVEGGGRGGGRKIFFN